MAGGRTRKCPADSRMLYVRIEAALLRRVDAFCVRENLDRNEVVAGLIRDHVPDLVIVERANALHSSVAPA